MSRQILCNSTMGKKIVNVKKYVTEQLFKHVLYTLQNNAFTTGCPPKKCNRFESLP